MKGRQELSFLTVAELNRAVAANLERSFPLMRVRGEIAQLTRASSGHWYFSLRDAAASVRAVMFRGKSAALDWQPKEGDQAVYLQNSAIEIEFNKEKYIVVPQSAILLLLRDDGLFE